MIAETTPKRSRLSISIEDDDDVDEDANNKPEGSKIAKERKKRNVFSGTYKDELVSMIETKVLAAEHKEEKVARWNELKAFEDEKWKTKMVAEERKLKAEERRFALDVERIRDQSSSPPPPTSKKHSSIHPSPDRAKKDPRNFQIEDQRRRIVVHLFFHRSTHLLDLQLALEQQLRLVGARTSHGAVPPAAGPGAADQHRQLLLAAGRPDGQLGEAGRRRHHRHGSLQPPPRVSASQSASATDIANKDATPPSAWTPLPSAATAASYSNHISNHYHHRMNALLKPIRGVPIYHHHPSFQQLQHQHMAMAYRSSGGGFLSSRSRFLPGRRSVRALRMRWTTTLHARFVHAVELLGGHESMYICRFCY
ncbi:uncharacterized protein [Triticum aestivum]|uniref:uncharacterized protein n=1 Tax=Triticum aestivum TaxID=4565 RepID=UPI001D006CF0|nr:uncharacterized protein LOC123056034 [Triticum aestivum]